MATPTTQQLNQRPDPPRELELPAPTAWPFVLAFGSTLLFAGLLTNESVSILGTVLALAGCVGWFREVLPREHEITVSVLPEEIRATTERRVVERVPVAPDQVRAWLPVQTYPISAGVKGGLAGSVAMAALACAYGVLKIGSIWYPINLLAASVYYQSLKFETEQLKLFHADSFLIALGLHLLVSTLVGLLYGAMLPMFPRRPIVLGGLSLLVHCVERGSLDGSEEIAHLGGVLASGSALGAAGGVDSERPYAFDRVGDVVGTEATAEDQRNL